VPQAASFEKAVRSQRAAFFLAATRFHFPERLTRVNYPTPAIVPQSAVRPLPRLLLLLLCFAYVVPGFVGRAPWKSLDITTYGYALALNRGETSWLTPMLFGMSPDTEGLLPYWLSAWSIQAFGGLMGAELASRLPFATLLWLALMATWYAVYYLARSPGAGPVAFAFGGEASEVDYARAMADGGLLALIACLGLAQPSHESSSYVVQLAAVAFIFFAAAAIPRRMGGALAVAALGLFMLALSGAPTFALLYGLGAAVLLALAPVDEQRRRDTRIAAIAFAVLALASCALAAYLQQWEWRLLPVSEFRNPHDFIELLVWFAWPAWPLALWSLWIWRRQIANRRFLHRHLWLPIWLGLLATANTIVTVPADRALLLGLPAFAALAAFALPTFRRAMAALIDWFTLLFFSVAALTIWVIWISVQTGVPPKPAANVARLAPGFAAEFSMLPLIFALAASVAWCLLVYWRAKRNRPEIWRSLVLPAGGTVLSWILMMTLWLPMLDYARSYSAQMAAMEKVIGPASPCIAFQDLSRAQLVAMQTHRGEQPWQLVRAEDPGAAKCRWLAISVDGHAFLRPSDERWREVTAVRRPTDRDAAIVLYRRQRP